MDEIINDLKNEISKLKGQLNNYSNFFDDQFKISSGIDWEKIPNNGNNPKIIKKLIKDETLLDFQPQLNTSSYVNVMLEQEEEEIAMMGLKVNLADQTVYPQSYKIHDRLVNMIAQLWNCPKPDDFEEYGVYPGAGTVGSTEACLLAGLAFKFRWKNWYHKKYKSEPENKPNIIISSCYQAAWEKLFKYMEIECRYIQPSISSFTISESEVFKYVDKNTIGVVCILGNHYGGQYDPIEKINNKLNDINLESGFQIGIHVDAASGGFIAPFQKEIPVWDFRLNNVLSISSSGHKYGESACGTGWIIWRSRKNLSEHVAISVTYLGGKADSYTLNFSRPASGIYVQYYKFLRYGIQGYIKCCESMMSHADLIRTHLRKMNYNGLSRFIILDNGNNNCLPVVTAMLNPDCKLDYDDIDLQHALSQHHWYVSAYKMGFNCPTTDKIIPIFRDEKETQTMFRIVVKSNITPSMIEHLISSFVKALEFLDDINFKSHSSFDSSKLRHKDQVVTNHC